MQNTNLNNFMLKNNDILNGLSYFLENRDFDNTDSLNLLQKMTNKAVNDKEYADKFSGWLNNEEDTKTVFLRDELVVYFKDDFKQGGRDEFFNAWCSLDTAHHQLGFEQESNGPS